jgi:CRP/FNR family transcriptional regulator, cyclic AMP receptor protein
MQADDDAKTLRWVEGFKELPAEVIRSISSKCKWRWYKPGQYIFSQNDESRDVFFIVQGTVRIASYSSLGKQVGFRDLTVGQCFGDLAAIDGLPRSATATAVSDAYLASMSVEAYWQDLMSYPQLAGACLKRLANLVRALSDRVIEYSLVPVPGRIALELLRLAQRRLQEDNSAMIDPAPTHAEIASRVATHREAVTKELRRLASSGVIVQKGRKIFITDVNALRSILGGYEETDSPHG